MMKWAVVFVYLTAFQRNQKEKRPGPLTALRKELVHGNKLLMEKDQHEVGLFAFYLFICAYMEINVFGSRRYLRMS